MVRVKLLPAVFRMNVSGNYQVYLSSVCRWIRSQGYSSYRCLNTWYYFVVELLYSYIYRVFLLVRHARMDSPQPEALEATFRCKRRASFVPLTIYPISISFVLRDLNLYLIDLLGNYACHQVTWTFTTASKLLELYVEIDLMAYSFLCFLE